MSWQLKAKPGLGSLWLIHLLPDGDVLVCSDESDGPHAWRLSPDDTGSYLHGTWRAASNPNYSRYGFSTTMSSDGRLVLHGSEYNSGHLHTEIYDPVADTWTIADVNPYINIVSHLAVNVLDDGKHLALAYDGTKTIHPDLLGFDQLTGANAAFAPDESGFCLLPDGRLLTACSEGHSSSPGLKSAVFSPAYASGYVAGGSVDGNNTWTTTDLSTYLATTLPSWKQASNRKLTSDGTILYEFGSLLYHPGIGKAVLLGGQGDVFTYDPALAAPNAWAQPTSLPLADPATDVGLSKYGTVHATYNGQSATAIVAGNAFVVDAGGSGFIPLSSAPNVGVLFVYVAGDTHWAKISYTSFTNNGTSALFTGLSLTSTYAGDTSAPFATGSVVSLGRPSYTSMDSPAVILPGGEVLFCAGIHQSNNGNNGFNQFCRFWTWNGSGAPTHTGDADTQTMGDGAFAGVTFSSFSEYGMQMAVLPSSEVMLANLAAHSVHIWQPNISLQPPVDAWRPTITSFPATVTQGQTVSMTGTQLTGLHEGAFFGDDFSSRTNFPVVRFINTSTGKVYYGRTSGYTYRGIQPGRPSGCSVSIPAAPPGTYNVEATVNGLASPSYSAVTVLAGPTYGVGTYGSGTYGDLTPAPVAWASTAAAAAAATGMLIFVGPTYGVGTYGSGTYGDLTPQSIFSGTAVGVAAVVASGRLDLVWALAGTSAFAAVATAVTTTPTPVLQLVGKSVLAVVAASTLAAVPVQLLVGTSALASAAVAQVTLLAGPEFLLPLTLNDGLSMVTANFIGMYGVDIVINRPGPYLTTPAGGQVPLSSVLLAPVRRIFQHTVGKNTLRVAPGSPLDIGPQGDLVSVYAVLIGLPGDDVRKDDTFLGPDGLLYKVRRVVTATLAWETRAECIAIDS